MRWKVLVSALQNLTKQNFGDDIEKWQEWLKKSAKD